MQHYGAATPLIDFSEDWRIALYFACERDENEEKPITCWHRRIRVLAKAAKQYSILRNLRACYKAKTTAYK